MEVNSISPYIYFQVIIAEAQAHEAYDFTERAVLAAILENAFLFTEIAQQFNCICLCIRPLFHILH